MIDLTKIDKTQANFLRHAFEHQQLAHSYLFVDRDEARAVNTAYWLACLFNCQGEQKPDGSCRNCQQILSGNHPDVLLVQAGEKASLGIDQVRPLKEELAKSPVESEYRFFFIRDAEKLTPAAANALLNLLEEPIAPVVTVLITNNSDQILPTIRSRTQILTFASDTGTSKTSQLLDNGLTNEEIADLGDTKEIDQACKYFYQECLAHNRLALVRAYKLAQLAKSSAQQKYVPIRLKLLAQKDLAQSSTRLAAARMLDGLMLMDKQRLSNVNLKQTLEYLALQWKR
ncbi:DNA polymerase III subunit [Lactobacillus corticis]|uniref:DNA polymerase III subunit delta n=1 Tax=Lactobacillus corticis TaxID=2201249 RepID=A0A916VIH4_9LACO|nr:DNA polymerase III subunit [Lactobacillus corticis]GFZ27298.1 DNA polymerase III subunit delta' [Lactobacillus corticis]